MTGKSAAASASDLLDRLINKLDKFGSDKSESERATLIKSHLPDSYDVDKLTSAARDRFDKVRGKKDLSDADASMLEALADIHNTVLPSALSTGGDAVDAIDDTSGDSDTDSDDDGGDTGPVLEGEVVEESSSTPSRELVGSAPMGLLPHAGKVLSASGKPNATFILKAERDTNNVRSGDEITSREDLGQACVDVLQALSDSSGSERRALPIGKWSHAGKSPILSPEMSLMDIDKILEKNGDPSQLTFNSKTKTFGQGFCSPSEIDYTLCPPASTEGRWNVPSTVVRRGGVRIVRDETFADVYGSGVGCFTEAEEIARTDPKPCFSVGCPTFDEIRLNLCSLCIEAPILTAWAFPEWIAGSVAKRLAAFEHQLACNLITAAEATATVVPPLTAPAGGLVPTVLGMVELQTMDIRYRHRLSPNAMMEAVMPLWLLSAMRSDLNKRCGVDMISKADAYINQMFANMNVRPQFIYNWQDAFCSGTPTDFGGTTPPAAWPSTVRIMVYPAGTFQAARGEIVRVSGVRNDPQMLRENVELALFLEVYWGLIDRCPEARILTVPVCPDGSTGGCREITCPTV